MSSNNAILLSPAPTISSASYSFVEYNNATADSSFLAMMLSCVEDHLALISENGLRKQREMMSRSNVSRDIQQYVNAVDSLINSIINPTADKKILDQSVIEFIKKMGIKINDNGQEKTIDEFIQNATNARQPIFTEGVPMSDDIKNVVQGMYNEETFKKWDKGESNTPSSEQFSKLKGAVQNGVLKGTISADGNSISWQTKHIGKLLDKGQLSAIKAALDHEVSRATDIVTQRQMGIQKDMGNFQTCVGMVNSTHSMLSQLNSKLADAMR